MKTKEEIEQLSYKYSDKVNMFNDWTSHSIADAVTYGYNQCQQDMAKNYTEREVVIMLQDCAIHFGIMNKSKDDGTFTTQIDKWVKNKLIELVRSKQ